MGPHKNGEWQRTACDVEERSGWEWGCVRHRGHQCGSATAAGPRTAPPPRRAATAGTRTRSCTRSWGRGAGANKGIGGNCVSTMMCGGWRGHYQPGHGAVGHAGVAGHTGTGAAGHAGLVARGGQRCCSWMLRASCQAPLVSLALPGPWGHPAAGPASLHCRQPKASRASHGSLEHPCSSEGRSGAESPQPPPAVRELP